MVEKVNWDAQLDNALINAAGVLGAAPSPTDLDEACQLANTWLNLADSWSRRQESEAKKQDAEPEHENANGC